MSNDQFALSIGQAQQLEFAFRRNGWTPADVHKLCEQETLGRVKSFISESGSNLSHGLVVAFQFHGISRDLLERISGPYSSEWRHRFPHTCHSEQAWEEWREWAVGKFLGVMKGDLVTISRDDLQQLEEVAERKDILESENHYLHKALAHFHRPVTEVFSKENLRRINFQDWNGQSSLMSMRTRVLKIFEWDNIVTVGDLVRISEYAIRRWPGMGYKSVNFIKRALADMDLHLGMEIPGKRE